MLHEKFQYCPLVLLFFMYFVNTFMSLHLYPCRFLLGLCRFKRGNWATYGVCRMSYSLGEILFWIGRYMYYRDAMHGLHERRESHVSRKAEKLIFFLGTYVARLGTRYVLQLGIEKGTC